MVRLASLLALLHAGTPVPYRLAYWCPDVNGRGRMPPPPPRVSLPRGYPWEKRRITVSPCLLLAMGVASEVLSVTTCLENGGFTALDGLPK